MCRPEMRHTTSMHSWARWAAEKDRDLLREANRQMRQGDPGRPCLENTTQTCARVLTHP